MGLGLCVPGRSQPKVLCRTWRPRLWVARLVRVRWRVLDLVSCTRWAGGYRQILATLLYQDRGCRFRSFGLPPPHSHVDQVGHLMLLQRRWCLRLALWPSASGSWRLGWLPVGPGGAMGLLLKFRPVVVAASRGGVLEVNGFCDVCDTRAGREVLGVHDLRDVRVYHRILGRYGFRGIRGAHDHPDVGVHQGGPPLPYPWPRRIHG